MTKEERDAIERMADNLTTRAYLTEKIQEIVAEYDKLVEKRASLIEKRDLVDAKLEEDYALLKGL